MSQDGKTGQIEYALDGDNLIITTDGEVEVTAVGLITRTWTVEDGKVIKTTDYNDGNPPMVDEESSMSSLDDALNEEKDGTCKKIKTAMCK